MSSAARNVSTGVSTGRSVTDTLICDGAYLFEASLDVAAASALLQKIRAVRAFDQTLFLDEAAFDRDPQYRGVNPRPGRNLLERFDADLAFVERDRELVDALGEVLGPDYVIMDRKVVCGVPARSVPDWLKARIDGAPVNNLGPYVKPDYRDVTYFYGIDFHQDIIDFKDRDADFLTLYVYLHPVGRSDAPLFLLKGSHVLGATSFPHALARKDAETWRYDSPDGQSAEVRQTVLTGQTGFAAIWHPFTLHGTQPDTADHERISLRYLIGRRSASAVGLDLVNAAIRGPLRLDTTRVDLAADGSPQIMSNTVRAAEG
ncbi:phytanoyl-CoA dioxygenase family protein [Brevundimonas sp. AJA228-03]|uniref:phytanoyl-CoA dioxygenase family protein n=1 Tax=Brevundimonas sp. AJA228-03 TaxID=2752515 RepID=UPI001ADF0F4F|nr:phytanoyl-CoA dioxygenase family protein [Brevundimonas sp. AJA228-03]QTN20525.1 phytanoyl-CoA dioxygenase family protein [Brevundimonas sp. AJA228-03]